MQCLVCNRPVWIRWTLASEPPEKRDRIPGHRYLQVYGSASGSVRCSFAEGQRDLKAAVAGMSDREETVLAHVRPDPKRPIVTDLADA